MLKTLSTSLEKDVQCVEERKNAENVKTNVENESSRPSRRALHRQAVKKFNERRKNEERQRLAEERDNKLIQSSNNSSSNNNNNNSSDNHSEQCSSLKVINKNSTKKPVLIGKWEFDFFFRTIPSELLPSRGEPVDTEKDQEESPSVLYNKEEQLLVVVNDDNNNDDDSRLLKSSVPLKAMMQSNLTKSIHVRRLEGVPPLPMIMPIPKGTDLDKPTRNYLLPDTTYNVHQHAPGFERDENTAKRSMLACAVREWRGGDDNVLVLSTGEALRSVFESTYGEAKPLALEVRRVGPTLLIDSHSERQFRTRVKDMREKALLGKALYRIHDESFSVKDNDSVNLSENGVVALPMHRVGSGALSKETRMLSRYSHIFRWEIGSMDVLVGIDTPIVLDHRDNTEYVLKLKDISVAMTPQEVQREALNSWFDATLANVPQVGIYVHNKGVIQQYEVKKAQEMLGRVEGSMATASMNFTTNVLQWLVAQCTKDGVTYAVLRNYTTGDLEIYECSKDEHFDKFLPGESKNEGDFITDPSTTDKTNNNNNNDSNNNNNGIDSMNTEETTTDEGTKEHHNATENERLNWGLATMCFRMGMHLKDSEKKASDAFSLLLRSFALYFQQKTRMEEASQHICDIVQSLPTLIRTLINGRKAELEEQGGIIQLPVVYREAFLACGRFEMRLQEAVYDETLPIPTRRTFLKCLLPCSAALCVCIARTIEQFSAERRVYLRLRAEKNRGSNMHIHSLIAKDLLQVVVEGLLRLEQMHNILKDDTTLTICTGMDQKEHQAALIDTKTEMIDITPLTRASWELYADVVLLVMSDRTPFTANVLVELSRRIKSREDIRNGENVHPSVTVSDGDIETSTYVSGRGSSSGGDNILTWLSSITHDPVSLSFTALRFLTKVGLESKRLLLKMAQVYYHVGHHHLLTDRYTKALESLHRAQSLFKAIQQAAADDVFGSCSIPSGTVTIKDVHHALGDVYIRMASLKSHLASVELRLSVQQPLAFGEVRVLSPEEEAFYRHAVDHFTNCEANARLAAALHVYASRMIGHIVCSGQQADVAKGRHIYSMLRKAGDLSSNDAVLDWEVLRLSTCATHHAALQHRAEEITSQWATASFSESNITTSTRGMPVVLESIIHPLEYLLQMALTSLVLLEMKKNMKTHQVMSIVRGCIAQLVVALNECQETNNNNNNNNNNASNTLLVRVLATWKARCSHEWICHMSLMISLRVMRVLMRLLPTGKTSGPKGVMQELVNIQKEMDDCVRTDICCGDECQFSKLTTSLVRVLEGVTKW